MDTYIPLPIASEITHMDEASLHHLIKVGKIKSVLTITGEILVSKKDVEPAPIRQDFAHLAGRRIGVREAGRIYGVDPKTISRWVAKGKIQVLESGDRGQKTMIDEADIAYMAAVYLQNPGRGKRTDKI